MPSNTSDSNSSDHENGHRDPEDVLIEIDYDILAKLSEGRCSPGYIARDAPIEQQASYVSRRLSTLVDADFVERVDRGLYELDNRGQEVLNDEQQY